MGSRDPAPAGEIILLNGPSRSGKTQLAKALQNELAATYLRMSPDHLWPNLPERILAQKDWWRLPVLRRILRGFHQAVASYAASGVGVIVEHCTTSVADIDECVALFAHTRVVFVEVTCAIEEIARRVVERSQYDLECLAEQLAYFAEFRDRVPYDLTVDTEGSRPEEVARHLVGSLDDLQEPTAFTLIDRQRLGGATPTY